MRPEFCNTGPVSWDVSKAHQIVSDGRHPVLQPVGSLLGFIARRRELPDGRIEIKLGHCINEHHVPNVDPDKSGIAAYAVDDYILIDGHHRVVRCEQLGRRTFPVYFMTQEESESCLDTWSLRFVREARRRDTARRAKTNKRRNSRSRCGFRRGRRAYTKQRSNNP